MSAVGPLPEGVAPVSGAVPAPDPGAGAVLRERARSEAERAARHAGVRITLLESPGELAEAEQVLRRVWGARPTDSSIATAAMMRAIGHAGGYVAGVRADPAAGAPLVGVCVGFCAAPAELSLHSHVAGLVEASVGHGAGRALKLDQRAWALEHGLTSITWTYDPLVSRNAYFNLHRLGAHLAEYLVDFYGPLEDGVNTGEPSDRALVRWALDDPRVLALAAGHSGRAGARARWSPGPDTGSGGSGDAPLQGSVGTEEGTPEPTVLLTEGSHGEPRPGAVTAEALLEDAAGRALVAAPDDIEGLRHRDPAAAHAWRFALRGAMLPLLDHGWEVAGFARGRGYLIERDR